MLKFNYKILSLEGFNCKIRKPKDRLFIFIVYAITSFLESNQLIEQT